MSLFAVDSASDCQTHTSSLSMWSIVSQCEVSDTYTKCATETQWQIYCFQVGEEVLGRAAKVTLGKENTTIVGDGSTQESVEARVRQIKNVIAETEQDYEKEKLNERVARYFFPFHSQQFILWTGHSSSTLTQARWSDNQLQKTCSDRFMRQSQARWLLDVMLLLINIIMESLSAIFSI